MLSNLGCMLACLRHSLMVMCLSCAPVRSVEDTSTGKAGTETSMASGSADAGAPTSSSTSNGELGTTSTGQASTSSEGETETDGCHIAKRLDMSNEPIECDNFKQDCNECEKCSPYFYDGKAFTGLKCVPVAPMPAKVGEDCIIDGKFGDGLDNCEKGSVCFNIEWSEIGGVCMALCVGSADAATCANPLDLCRISGEAIIPLCFPKCNPLEDPSCSDSDQVCAPLDSNGFVCMDKTLGGGGEKYDSCSTDNACQSGNICAQWDHVDECDAQSTGCCLAFCDISLSPNPKCDTNNGEVCVAWYPPDQAPDGYENVGFCGVPE